MKRLAWYIIALFLLLVISSGAYLWITRVSRVERFLSSQLMAEVTIENVKIGWNKLRIQGLRIENPSQSPLPYAFQADEIFLQMSPFEIWEQTIHIDQVKVQNPTLGIQLFNSAGSDNNWARFLNHFPSGGDRKFIIKKLSIMNLQFKIIRSNGKELSVPTIPLLELDNLGEKNALTLSQLARVLFQTILHILSNKASQLGPLLDEVTTLPSNLLDGVSTSLPLEDGKGMVHEGIDTIKRKTQEATDFLHGLFGK